MPRACAARHHPTCALRRERAAACVKCLPCLYAARPLCRRVGRAAPYAHHPRGRSRCLVPRCARLVTARRFASHELVHTTSRSCHIFCGLSASRSRLVLAFA
eukprot:3041680-Pleurochrysis_carterae.AAC.1